MKSQIVEIVNIISLAKLGEKFTSWNHYLQSITNQFVETSLPTQGQSQLSVNPGRKLTGTLLSNCAYHPGAKIGKKHALNMQYALNSELRLLTRVYGIHISRQTRYCFNPDDLSFQCRNLYSNSLNPQTLCWWILQSWRSLLKHTCVSLLWTGLWPEHLRCLNPGQ